MPKLSLTIKASQRAALAVALVLTSSPGLAESQAAERALAQLMIDVQRLQPALTKSNSEDGYYTTRPGDTVDMILKRMLPNVPVKKAILRQALVKANPHAFKRSNPNWMYAHKKLRLPVAKDIHNVIFVEKSGHKNSKVDVRLNWVKYP